MLKGYYVTEKDEDYGIAVVAKTSQQAKSIGYNSGEFSGDYIDIRVHWKKNAVVDGLPIGVLEDLRDGLKRGFYGYVEYGLECDVCHSESRVEYHDNKIICNTCQDEGHN